MDRPTLRTERLVMLQLGPPDLDETAALYGDAEVMRHVATGPMDRATTSELLEGVARTWRDRGWGMWAIRDASTGAFLGEGGLRSATDLVDEGVPADVDFGYTLCRRAWGQGYATEAGEAILADAWDRFDGADMHALVTSDDLPSQKVLRKLGFERLAKLTRHERAHQVWSISRPG